MPAELLSKYNGKLYQPHHVVAELPPELHVESIGIIHLRKSIDFQCEVWDSE